MAHQDELDTSFIKNPDVAHEESDVSIRPIAWFMIWLTVATAVVMLLMIGLYRYLDTQAIKQDERQRSPIADERNPIPPQPVLQMAPTEVGANGQLPTRPPEGNNSPTAEFVQVRREETQKLENYTWIDQSKGMVSLPIDRAAELALERGLLKSRPQPATSMTAAPPAGQELPPGRK
ncbi:MAG TPA: hypothetical protein VKA60_00365 [Blastocatellia bacterium]|nr:hypothetical protein [Blastocatellia bacterium]